MLVVMRIMVAMLVCCMRMRITVRRIRINVDGQDRIVFTGSKNLISQIEQINKDDFPIETKIEIINKNGYIFS